MNGKEYEEHLSHLTNDQYDALIQERIERLSLCSGNQKAIAQAREVARLERQKLIDKLKSPEATEDDNEAVYNALRDGTTDNCEHGRSYCKHCIVCAEIDHLMFPELYDEDGERIEGDDA
jgi:hypothetical protein